MWITQVCSHLRKRRVQYAVAGGYALAIHRVPRLTLDLDLVVRWTLPNLNALESALHELGLVSRLPIRAEDVFRFRNEYVKNRNLIAWNFYHPADASALVDILIPHDLRDWRTKSVEFDGETVRVLDKQDLIRMKRAAGRPQDLEDVAALEHRK
jgi:hypothetical protein